MADPTGDTHTDVDDLKAELERVRRERDDLRKELVQAEPGRPSRHVVRRVTAVVLVIVSCASFLTGGVGIWASRNFLDTDVWVQRTGPLIDDPAVQAAISTKLTDSVMELVDPEALFKEALPERGQLLAGPLSGAVRSFVSDQVATVVDSEAFARLWVEINRQAHAAAVRVLKGDSEVVTARDQTVTLDLLPVVNKVLARLTSVSPEIFGRIVEIPDITVDQVPASAIETINERFGTELPSDFGQITIYDQGKLKELQDAVKLFDRIVWLSVVVFVAATIGAIALSVDRRRTVLQLAIADAVLLVLLRRGAIRAEEQVLGLVKVEANRPAVKAVTTALFQGLFDGTRLLLWFLAIVILVAAVTGPWRWAVRVRSVVSATAVGMFSSAREHGSDPATLAWLAQHRDALMAAGAGVALVLLWWLDLSWFAILVLLALVGAWVVLVSRLPKPPTGTGTPGEAPT